MGILKRVFPRRGPMDSNELNNHIEDVRTELSRIAEVQADVESDLSRRRLDDALSRNAGSNGAFKERYDETVKLASELNDIIDTTTSQRQVFSFFDTSGIHYEVDDGFGTLNGYSTARRCLVDPLYGHVSLPLTDATSLFYSATTSTDESLFVPEAELSLSELSAVAADSIESSDGRNALDGSSFDPYLIRAVYDLSSSVTEVVFDVNISVPQEIARRANMLTIEPAPELGLNITDIRYSSSSPVATSLIPGIGQIPVNKPIYDTAPLKFIFGQIDIVSLKITISSKHWRIENGRKVFYAGFRELGLFLNEWDATWSNAPGAFTNNGFFLRMDIPQVTGVSPSAAYFGDIVAIYATPELGTSVSANGTDTGVRVMVFEDDTLGSVALDSVGGSFPYTVTGDRDHLWLNVELDRNNDSGDVPLLQNLVVEYTVKS